MSEGAGNNATPSGSNPPKAVPSLAKRPGDVTRGGSTKLKFIPTLPARRAKEDVKKEDPPAASSSTERGRGRGRGGADGRGRGRGRGGEGRGAAPSRPPAVEMTASGPFAMGPALAGQSARRAAPRANFTPVMPQGPPGSAAKLGAGLTQTLAPTLGLKRDAKEGAADKGQKTEEDEVYSDADEGVEIIDMEKVREMDWMAPEALRKVKEGKKKKVKVEEQDKKGKGIAKEEAMEDDSPEGTPGVTGVNLANAVDLSESEEEEEMEDIIDDFAVALDAETGESLLQERLYFFQFPDPLPEFVPKAPTDDKGKSVDRSEPTPDGTKTVTFAEGTKPGAPGVKPEVQDDKASTEKLDGVIGKLEIYQSGAVKMRLSNGILLDVNAATQPSFLQHAVYLNPAEKKLCVLGHVNRRFVVSPDIDTLLAAMELPEEPQNPEMEGLISMDTT